MQYPYGEHFYSAWVYCMCGNAVQLFVGAKISRISNINICECTCVNSKSLLYFHCQLM